MTAGRVAPGAAMQDSGRFWGTSSKCALQDSAVCNSTDYMGITGFPDGAAR